MTTRLSTDTRSFGALHANRPGQIGVHEAVQISIEHGVRVARLIASAEVLYQVVRMDHVRADLVAPPRLNVLTAQRQSFGFSFFGLDLDQLRPQNPHGRLSVL